MMNNFANYLKTRNIIPTLTRSIAMGRIPTVQTQYLVNAARVCIRMPTNGDIWFFVEPKTTVGDFKNLLVQEDTQISTIDLLKSNGQTSDSESLYELFEKGEPLFVKLNNITYQFNTSKKEDAETKGSLQVGSVDKYYKQCSDLGLTSISATTISMMANNIIKNLPDTKIESKDLSERFIKEAGFFEQSVVREQIYHLYSIKLSLQAELDQLEARYEEISKKEHRK